jgi:hypothetical protein
MPIYVQSKFYFNKYMNNNMSLLNKGYNFFRTKVAKINFFIASTALIFQMTVLYPWHHQLDKDFEEFKIKTEKLLDEKHKSKLVLLAQIDTKLSDLQNHVDGKVNNSEAIEKKLDEILKIVNENRKI